MILFLFCFFASSMNTAKEEGKALGHIGKIEAFSQIENYQSQDFIPLDQRGKSFDPKKSKEALKTTPHSELIDYLQDQKVQKNKSLIANDEYFLQRSEKISQTPTVIEEAHDYHIETCQQAGTSYPISVIRDLEVKVVCEPAEFKEVKICCQHEYKEKFQSKKEAEKQIEALKHNLSSDPTIKSFQVNNPKGGIFHRYLVEARWDHIEDAATCQLYQTQRIEICSARSEEIGEIWVYTDQALHSLSLTPDCTFIQSECLDHTPSKIINNKEVQRSCWKEKLTFLCQTNSHDCPLLKKRNCELIKKECLKKNSRGCLLWELTFKCYSNVIKRHLDNSQLYGLDEAPTYEPNDSFSEITTKLALFDAIKKELEDTQAKDARAIQVFKGKRMECGKSIADKVMYDCCFTHSGLAKELGFKNCNADEVALAEMRANGLCHYTGSYEEKFLDLWKSRDQHVFCCFGSKLARILHENAYQQLSIARQSPKQTDCRGLSMDEISHLDFSKMDFSELSNDKKLPDNFHNKLQSFEKSIKEKVRNHEKA